MTPSRIATPPAPAPAEQPPDDIAWASRHWRALAGMTAILGYAGYKVISPQQQIDALTGRFEKAYSVQATRDSLQDVAIRQMQETVTAQLRALSDGQDDMIVGQCLRETNRAVRVQLQCTNRLRGER